MKTALMLKSRRDAHLMDGISDTMTAGELAAYFSQFDADKKVYLVFPDPREPAWYGRVSIDRFCEAFYDDEKTEAGWM